MAQPQAWEELEMSCVTPRASNSQMILVIHFTSRASCSEMVHQIRGAPFLQLLISCCQINGSWIQLDMVCSQKAYIVETPSPENKCCKVVKYFKDGEELKANRLWGSTLGEGFMLVSKKGVSLHGTRLGLMRATVTREPGGSPKLFYSWLSSLLQNSPQYDSVKSSPESRLSISKAINQNKTLIFINSPT